MTGDQTAAEFTADEVARLLEERDGQLSDREAGVLRMRFGLMDGRRKTLAEIGKVYGVSNERVRQIQARALAKLEQPWQAAPALHLAQDADVELEDFDFGAWGGS